MVDSWFTASPGPSQIRLWGTQDKPAITTHTRGSMDHLLGLPFPINGYSQTTTCVWCQRGSAKATYVARSTATLAPNVGLLRPGRDIEVTSCAHGQPPPSTSPFLTAAKTQRRRGEAAQQPPAASLPRIQPGAAQVQPAQQPKAPCSRRDMEPVPRRPGGGGGALPRAVQGPPRSYLHSPASSEPIQPAPAKARPETPPPAKAAAPGLRSPGWRGVWYVKLGRCRGNGIWGLFFNF